VFAVWECQERSRDRISVWRSGSVRDLVSHASSLDIDAAHWRWAEGAVQRMTCPVVLVSEHLGHSS
jgi:hypothetical protein